MYQIELMWNREFHFVPYGYYFNDLVSARKCASSLTYSGDCNRVKKCRITDAATGEVIVPSHRINSLPSCLE
jgi:hypothetical protein